MRGTQRFNRWGVAAAVLCLALPSGAGAAVIAIGSAEGLRGTSVAVAVTLETMGAEILGVANQIGFDRATPIAANESGQPDCAVNPAINKNATGFRFHPLGCDPAVNCQSMRALVLAFDNLDPIPDGATLYTCRIAIAPDAALGAYPLTSVNANASLANGGEVPTTGTDGEVSVSTDPVASIDIGSAAGEPGSTVTVAVTLALLGEPAAAIGAVQHDLTFDPLTPVAATTAGAPDCVVPGGGADLTTFAFQPAGCIPGTDCTGVRAILLSAAPEPFEDGATLYTCEVAIALDAVPGTTHALEAAGASAADLDGVALPVLTSAGEIEILEPTPPPPVCVGDCMGDGVVSINELLIGVNLAVGRAPLSTCPVYDTDGDGQVQVNELIRAVANALNGCPTGPLARAGAPDAPGPAPHAAGSRPSSPLRG